MSRPNLPPSATDIARLFDRVDTLERLYRPRGPNVVGELGDVNADLPAHLDTLLYDTPSGKWKNGPAGNGFPATAFYADSPTDTSIPDNTATKLIWPTLFAGTEVLDFTDPTNPVALADGVYTLDATVQGMTNFTTPTDIFLVGAAFQDLSSGFLSVNSIETNFFNIAVSLTSFLHAGSSVLATAIQRSGGALDARLFTATVTWQP